MPQPISTEQCSDLLQQLDTLDTISDIELLQKKLQQDYKLVSKQFAQVRVKRVDSYLKKIDEVQHRLRRNFNNYYHVIEQGHQGKNSSAKNNNFMTDASGKKDLPQAPVSPVLTPISVFPQVFDSMTEAFQGELDVLKSKFHYESKLIEDSARSEVECIWQRYAQEKIRYKQEKRRQLSTVKYELVDDYCNLSKYAKLSKLEKRYRSSVRKVTEKKDKSVFNFAKKSVLDKYKPPRIIESDALLTRLSMSEIDQDLHLIHSNDLNSIIVSKEEANYKYMEKAMKKSQVLNDSMRPTMTDLVNLQLENGGNGNVIPFETVVSNEGSRDRAQQKRKLAQQQMKQQRLSISHPNETLMNQQQRMQQQQQQQQQQFLTHPPPTLSQDDIQRQMGPAFTNAPFLKPLNFPQKGPVDPLQPIPQGPIPMTGKEQIMPLDYGKKSYGRDVPPQGNGQFQLHRFAR